MNEKNDVIITVEGNYLGVDIMQSEERDEYEESEKREQSMEIMRRANSGTGMDRLEMIFDGKRYVHGQHYQFLLMK